MRNPVPGNEWKTAVIDTDIKGRAMFFKSIGKKEHVEHREGNFLRVDFQPNPNYSPQSMEERVLHAMTGSMLIDQFQARLHELNGRLPEDINIGFGLIATFLTAGKYHQMFGRTHLICKTTEQGNATETGPSGLNVRKIPFREVSPTRAISSTNVTVPSAIINRALVSLQ